MIYDVRQTTSYTYASTVAYAHHVLRLSPIDRKGQRVQAASPFKDRSAFAGCSCAWAIAAHKAIAINAKKRVA